jgi:hypothetical protein
MAMGFTKCVRKDKTTCGARLLIWLMVFCLLWASAPARAAPALQDDEPHYTVGECQNLDRNALRAQIEQVALGVLESNSGALDIDALVARKWAELGVDAVIDAEVARAVADLSAQEDYLSRLWSAWSADKAEEFATVIAEDAFRSPAFGAKLDELAAAIGAEIARTIDAEFVRAASVAFLCLQEYVGERYSAVLFDAFQRAASGDVNASQIDIETSALDLSLLDVHKAGLVGVSLIVISEVSRRISQKVGQKIAQRVAGKVVGRVAGRAGSAFLPVIGWVVGIGLIVWDLYEGGKGALPQIQQGLSSEEVKQRIRSEISDAVSASLPEEVNIAALEIAVTLLDEWDSFCDGQQDLCQLAATNPSFRALLDSTPLSELDHLASLVGVFVNDLGRSALDQSIETGAFDSLVAAPGGASRILAATDSVTITLAWVELAGDQLEQVISRAIYEQAQPDELSAEALAALLALDDGDGLRRLLALDAPGTALLLALPPATLQRLTNELSLDDLRWLVGYLGQPASAVEAITLTQVVSDLSVGAITVDQLRVTPSPTAMSILSDVAPATSQVPVIADDSGRSATALPVTVLLLIVLTATAVGVIVWQRRRRVV